jgi:hypothetical protein
LDGLWSDIAEPDKRVFLKADVQGYERQVLDGVAGHLDRITGLQLELSMVPLYEGGWLYDEALDWARQQGFLLMRLIPGFTDQRRGQMLQADGVFFRSLKCAKGELRRETEFFSATTPIWSLRRKALSNDPRIAVRSRTRSVTNWGTGAPRREFLHVDDMTAACLHLLEHYDGQDEVNVGTGSDVIIKEIASMVADTVGFAGETSWDPSKPDGTPQNLLDVSKLAQLGWTSQIGLQEGDPVHRRMVSRARRQHPSVRLHALPENAALSRPSNKPGAVLAWLGPSPDRVGGSCERPRSVVQSSQPNA